MGNNIIIPDPKLAKEILQMAPDLIEETYGRLVYRSGIPWISDEDEENTSETA